MKNWVGFREEKLWRVRHSLLKHPGWEKAHSVVPEAGHSETIATRRFNFIHDKTKAINNKGAASPLVEVCKLRLGLEGIGPGVLRIPSPALGGEVLCFCPKAPMAPLWLPLPSEQKPKSP